MIVLIAGGSCSGKTTLAMKFKNATIISMDDFYLAAKDQPIPKNFDKPNALDFDSLYEAVKNLKAGKSVVIPQYNMLIADRDGSQVVKPMPTIIVEGMWTMTDKRLRQMADLMIYLDTSPEERVKRRIIRDIEKGRDMIQTLMFSVNVEQMHIKYVEPQKKYADLVL